MLLHKTMTKIIPTQVDWKLLYEVVALCNQACTPRGFGVDILEYIGRLCPFQQGLLYLIDANHHLMGHYLKNIEERYNQAYLEYYVDSDNGSYDAFVDLREDPESPTINVHNWQAETSSDFIPNYINDRGLCHSVGFALFDLNNSIRMVVSLDRTQDVPFTNRELYYLKLAVAMLNSSFKKFFYHGTSWSQIDKGYLREQNLTPREIEVADFMSQGISPANISKILCISQSTTYKHIAHIYAKLGVSNKQELLVKLLRKPNKIQELL